VAPGAHDPQSVAMKPEAGSQSGSSPSASPQPPAGFSRADLLVTLAVLAALAAVQLPSLANSRHQANAALCLSSLDELTRAWRMYADDNEEVLVASGPGQNAPDWTGGDWTGGFPSRNCSNLICSPLWRYTRRDIRVFACPDDPFTLSPNPRQGPHLRTRSMNSYLGGSSAWFTPSSGWRLFWNYADVEAPKPADAWVLIDEREDSINDGSFVVDMTGYPNLQQTRLIDFPADFHAQGAGISFADGHAELKTWLDARTLVRTRIINTASPNNEEVRWLQERSTSRLP